MSADSSSTAKAVPSSSSSSSSTQRKFIKRPDDKAMKEEVESLKKEIKKLDLTNNELNAQIQKLQIDQKVMDERNKLQAELKVLISKQSSAKNERNNINDQIKSIDASMKKKIAEIQQQTSKNSFKTVGEIDARIDSLDKAIDAGNLKLADERRYVKEMSALRKLRKDFGSIEKIQTLIDQDKEKIAELKKKLQGTHNKEVQAQFETIQKKLDEINESNKSVISKRNKIYDQRSEIKKQKDAKYDEIRKLRSDFDAKFENFKKQMEQEKLKRDEEYKAQQAERKQAKLKQRAEQELADASIPAFTEEINSIHNLLSYFDPSYVKPATKTASSTNGSSAIPSTTKNQARVIEFPEDLVIVKKEQDDFFTGTKKKGKAAKKHHKKNFTVAPEIIVALSDLTIPYPLKEEDVAETIKTLKETLEALQEKQEEQTKVNIERAQAKIAKFKEEDFEDDEEDEEDQE